MPKFKVMRFFADDKLPPVTVKTGLTEEQAQAHCKDPQTSWRTATTRAARERTKRYGAWFDGYTEQ